MMAFDYWVDLIGRGKLYERKNFYCEARADRVETIKRAQEYADRRMEEEENFIKAEIRENGILILDCVKGTWAKRQRGGIFRTY